jgi:GDP-L-fucose synthase
MTNNRNLKDAKIYIAGHRGMVGSAIIRQLNSQGITNIITRTHAELDLCNQQAVRDFIQNEKPDYIVLAAAKVGGIHANNEYPAEFIYQNMMMEANVIHEAWSAGVKNLLFLGSSCIYPKFANQPMAESELLTGVLEPTNEPYAIAKIAGIKLCESYNRQYETDYRSVMPTNLYGPGDNYHGLNSHVVPAMIKRFHEAKLSGAKTVEVWGTGKVKREFLHVDDMASACVFVMQLDKETYQANTQPMLSHINVGTGEDVTIAELAQIIKDVVGFEGELVFDAGKPEGAPRKLLDVSRLSELGWRAEVSMLEGLESAYSWF